MRPNILGVIVVFGLLRFGAQAWDYEIHRVINMAASELLPTNFPISIRSPVVYERLAFLGGEPDRWYNSKDKPLRHANTPDHYIDLEDVWGMGYTLDALPAFRYVFVMEAGRRRNVKTIPERDPDYTRALTGFLPWAITENTCKLKSCFSYLRAYERLGTPEEVENARQNVLYVMGLLGHLVGDATQPLHTTIHYNGWVGLNTNGYTTNRSFHRWIDGEYLLQTGGIQLTSIMVGLRPAQVITNAPDGESLFRIVIQFIEEQRKQVEPLYRLEKEGKLSGVTPNGTEGRAFLISQIQRAAQFLADLWYTAYFYAPEDVYLLDRLRQRQLQQNTASPK